MNLIDDKWWKVFLPLADSVKPIIRAHSTIEYGYSYWVTERFLTGSRGCLESTHAERRGFYRL